ncbi:MAG: hypothetical protein HYT88_01925 [Candidatus Omnitrophica bacterium]|nr:hypothetical protein [Candidatus Omnitrophota bacterium]
MRLLGWVVAIILVGGVALGLTDRSSGSVDSKPVDRREVLFTYRARLTQLPPHAKTVNVWIPLAKTTGQQQIFLRQVHAPVPYAIAQDPLSSLHVGRWASRPS